MACMEHYCFDCKRGWMNNELHRVCLYCQSKNVSNWFDQPDENPNREVYDDVCDDIESDT